MSETNQTNGSPQPKPVLLEVRNLKKHFPIARGVFRRVVGQVYAVDGVTFDIREGETLGMVGESGCGKSTTGRSVLQLLEPTAGEVIFKGQELTKLKPGELRKMRRHMQMIFQDPYASLNPRMTVGSIIGEPLEIHNIGNVNERRERVQELLALVGLNPISSTVTPTNFPVVSVNASVWLVPSPPIPSSSFVTNLSPPSTYPFKRRSSTFWTISKNNWA